MGLVCLGNKNYAHKLTSDPGFRENPEKNSIRTQILYNQSGMKK